MTCPEGLTLPHTRTEARQVTLDLLLPHDLPAEAAPAPYEAARIAATLRAFLATLDRPQARAAQCRALLESLGAIPVTSATAGVTQIPAKTAEVEDFDRYFHVRRVACDAPALPLLRGLLQTASSVFDLADRADLPPAQIDRLVTGFAAYARLLARLCDADARP